MQTDCEIPVLNQQYRHKNNIQGTYSRTLTVNFGKHLSML